ncbi:MAG: energy-coupling factor ABC transporter ATP-binding protein [Alistipes sp.]|jgi:cobalt/nickel transport system ATP-binding protein
MSHHYLRFEQVTYRYPDGHEALHDVSFELKHGEKAAVVGANGAGKSTLLLHTDGLLLPTSGRVVVGGVPVTRRTLPTIRRTVGYLFQQPDDQLFMPTVGEDIAFGPANMALDDAEIERRVVNALEAVGALELRDHSPAHLSGGQKKRVAIATILAMEPSILVMDEPTAALDPQARRQLIELIRIFDHTTLIATHDLELVHELCPRTLLLHDGRLVADCPTSDVIATPLYRCR